MDPLQAQFLLHDPAFLTFCTGSYWQSADGRLLISSDKWLDVQKYLETWRAHTFVVPLRSNSGGMMELLQRKVRAVQDRLVDRGQQSTAHVNLVEETVKIGNSKRLKVTIGSVDDALIRQLTAELSQLAPTEASIPVVDASAIKAHLPALEQLAAASDASLVAAFAELQVHAATPEDCAHATAQVQAFIDTRCKPTQRFEVETGDARASKQLMHARTAGRAHL